MTANPIDLVGGLTTAANVPKADLTAWVKARVPQLLANAAEVNSTLLAGQLFIILKASGAPYFLDTADTTTLDDGLSCIISLDAKRFKILPGIPIDTDGTLSLNSDTRIASQKAVKTYVDQIIAAQDAMVFKGVTDCSANPNYPAADRGWTYRVSVAGKIGGASGTVVEAGDLFICLTDGTVSGTQAAVGANWTVAQTNIDGAVVGPASAVSANFPSFNGATGKLLQDSGKAVPAGAVVGTTDPQTLTTKTVDTANNTFKLNGVAFGTAAQATAALSAMVGDSGSGGTKGLVPAPGTGDAAAGKFLKADGTFAVPSGAGGTAPLLTGSVSNAATIDIDFSSIVASYRKIRVYLYDLTVANSGACVDLMVSSNAGSTWDNSAGQYNWQFLELYDDATGLFHAGTTDHATLDFQYRMSTSFGTVSGYGGAFDITFHNPKGTTVWKYIEHTGTHAFTDGKMAAYKGGGHRKTLSAINAVRIRAANNNNTGAANGNISANWAVYGE